VSGDIAQPFRLGRNRGSPGVQAAWRFSVAATHFPTFGKPTIPGISEPMNGVVPPEVLAGREVAGREDGRRGHGGPDEQTITDVCGR
jgi:hypothetical protein